MKRGMKIFLSVLGGIEVTFSMFIPIFIAALWVTVGGVEDWTQYLFYSLGLVATLFRAIKIGWLNEESKW